MESHVRKLNTSDSLQAVERSTVETQGDEAFSVAPMEARAFAIGKRLMDVCIALPVVCFLLPPLMVFVAVLHVCVSRGPLFFRQERCGRQGEMFSILKFRTMTPVGTSELDSTGDPESRVFRFGHLVRFSKIDEVPQFVNVLRGEMSVVGPRPHHRQDSINFGKRVAGYRQREIVKPGITGLAQIREYAGEFRWNCTDSRVEADLDYIRTRSLLLDLNLVVRTFTTVAWKCQQKLVRSVLPVSMEDSGVTLPFSSTESQTASKLGATEDSEKKAA